MQGDAQIQEQNVGVGQPINGNSDQRDDHDHDDNASNNDCDNSTKDDSKRIYDDEHRYHESDASHVASGGWPSQGEKMHRFFTKLP